MNDAQLDPMRWRHYELLVEQICRELGAIQGVKVFSKRKYESNSGREIEIDVSFELEALGSRILGLIECKHYGRRIEAAQVLAFAKTIERVGAHKGIMISTVGFQSGAILEAGREGIALALLVPEASQSLDYVLRDPSDKAVLLRGRVHIGPQINSENRDGIFFASALHLVRAVRRFDID